MLKEDGELYETLISLTGTAYKDWYMKELVLSQYYSDIPRDDVACDDVACDDVACDDVACDDASCDDASCDDVSCDDASCDDASCDDVSCDDASCDDVSCDDVANQASSLIFAHVRTAKKKAKESFALCLDKYSEVFEVNPIYAKQQIRSYFKDYQGENEGVFEAYFRECLYSKLITSNEAQGYSSDSSQEAVDFSKNTCKQPSSQADTTVNDIRATGLFQQSSQRWSDYHDTYIDEIDEPWSPDDESIDDEYSYGAFILSHEIQQNDIENNTLVLSESDEIGTDSESFSDDKENHFLYTERSLSAEQPVSPLTYSQKKIKKRVHFFLPPNEQPLVDSIELQTYVPLSLQKP